MIRPENIHVLIIEPSQDKSDILSLLLKNLGVVSVQQTQHFRNLQKIVGSQTFDLVVLGDNFDDSTPSEALRFIQHHPATKTVPIIWTTHSDSPGDARNMISEGVTEVLNQPLDLPALRSALRNFFRQVRSKEIVSLIRKASFFEEFSKEEISSLTKVAIPRYFEAGSTILEKGDPPGKFFVLLSGRVEVLSFPDKNSSHTLIIPEGQPFGEMSVLDHAPRSAFCIAADDCLALEIGQQIVSDPNYHLRLKIFAKLAVGLTQKLRRMNTISDTLHVRIAELETSLEKQSEQTFPIPKPANIPVETAKKYYTAVPAPIAAAQADETEPSNPFCTPTGSTDKIDSSLETQEEYDVLQRKINLRTDFMVAKIPNTLSEILCNKLCSYLTGGKLAKMNPHRTWSPKSFTEGTPRLKHSLHLVVASANGANAYSEAYLNLPQSHQVVGLSQTGCSGTFLDSEDALKRYLAGQNLERALAQDLEMPIDRLIRGESVIEFLTHTSLDVRPETLFLIFDDTSGSLTARVRTHYPEHQILTTVHDYSFDVEENSTFFTMPEEDLNYGGHLVPRKEWQEKGYYLGETFFLPDLSGFFRRLGPLEQHGYIFACIGLIAKLGPDYSGITWGSKGGADGAVRAARAMYGMKGAQSSRDLADAINWADQ